MFRDTTKALSRAGAALCLAMVVMTAMPQSGRAAAAREALAKTTVEQLALAAGVRVTDLTGLNTSDWSEAGVTLHWAVASDDAQPWLLVQQTSAAAVTLRLAAGREVSLLAWLDLRGTPAVINLLQPPAHPASVQPVAAGPPLQPAALLRIQHRLDSGELRSTLMMIGLGAAPAVLWREVEASQQPQRGGYRSHQLAVKTAMAGATMTLELAQATLPGTGAQAQLPGPPLSLSFSFDGKTYRRTRP